MEGRPPPNPPPHGSSANSNNSGRSGGLPPGNYDIFVIPPHSSGSGFLYLPSLQVQRNSFLAGVACTLFITFVWAIVYPAIKRWASTVFASGGMGVVFLVLFVGIAAWAYGKTQLENSGHGTGHGGSTPADTGAWSGASTGGAAGGRPNASAGATPKPSWQRPPPSPGSGSTWEKMREETRRKEEERKRKEDAARKEEKEKLERARNREREAREKEIREKMAQMASDKGKKDQKQTSPTRKNYQKPTAQTVGDEYSYRPYDEPKGHGKTASQSSFVSGSSYSYTHSHSTAQTTPPPSHRGPYVNNDPEKVTIKAVYAFKDSFNRPFAQLITGTGHVTNGLVLKINTEGLFIDDDVRKVPQREWDVKAWTMKLVEVSVCKSESSYTIRSSSCSPFLLQSLKLPAFLEDEDR